MILSLKDCTRDATGLLSIFLLTLLSARLVLSYDEQNFMDRFQLSSNISNPTSDKETSGHQIKAEKTYIDVFRALRISRLAGVPASASTLEYPFVGRSFEEEDIGVRSSRRALVKESREFMHSKFHGARRASSLNATWTSAAKIVSRVTLGTNKSSLSIHKPHYSARDVKGCAFAGRLNSGYCRSGGKSLGNGKWGSKATFPTTRIDLIDNSIQIPISGVDGIREKFQQLSFRLEGEGPPVKVTVLGGSMTLGGNCDDSRSRRRWLKCSWPSQLNELLRRRYHGRIHVYSVARAATSLDWSISMIPTLIPQDSDIIVVDYIQNDARPTLEDLFDSSVLNVQTSIIAERWILKLKEYFERKKSLPMVIFFLSYPPPGFSTTDSFRALWQDEKRSMKMRRIMWDHYKSYAQVLHHYGIPYVTLQSVLWPKGPQEMPIPGIWESINGGIDKHPSWGAHKTCADVMFHALQAIESDALSNISEEEKAEKRNSTLLPKHWPKETAGTFWPVEKLGNSSACSSYASFVNSENKKSFPLTLDAGWKRYEDRPGKPGWIGAGNTTSESSIEFAVRCGEQRVIGIEYLESYEGMGRVQVTFIALKGTMNIFEEAYDHNHPEKVIEHSIDHVQKESINGRCSRKTSLRTVREFKVDCFREGMEDSLIRVKFSQGPNVKPGGKFKIVSVYSC